MIEFACGIPQLLKGSYSENVSTNVDVYSIRQPLGPVAIISPFNFPAMVPAWFFPIAIACGNTVVLKPSEKDPSASIWLAERWAEVGLPAGRLQRRPGRQGGGRPPARAPGHQGGLVRRLDADRPLRLRERDPDTASGCRRSGGRRTTWSCSRTPISTLRPTRLSTPASGQPASVAWPISALVAVEPVADELISKIVERMSGLKIGDGHRETDMGPLVTRAHRDKVAALPGCRRRGGCRARRRRPEDDAGRRRGRLLARPDVVRQGDAGDVDLHRRDLRAGALGAARADLRGRTRARQHQPVRERHRHLHQ